METAQRDVAGIFNIPKLRGRENFNSWKFAMRACLEIEDLWRCIEGQEADLNKITKARARIILSLDPINYVHVQGTKTAKEAWEKLQITFEDSGLTRRVGLLKILVTTQLKDCKSVDEYVNKVISTAHKLNDLKFEVPDEWVGTLLLAGLPEEYDPMIMGLESSGTKITADAIKTKLLQDVKSAGEGRSTDSENALFVNKKTKQQKTYPNKVRCFACNKYGHFASNCRSKYKKKGESTNNANKTFYSLSTSNETQRSSNWYIDSCASSHMTWQPLSINRTTTNNDVIASDNKKMKAEAMGDTNVDIIINKKCESVKVKEVLYVPELAANLLSVSKLVKRNYKVIFDKSGCKIIDANSEVVATGSEDNGIFKLNECKTEALYSKENESTELWHRRLGHLNRKGMNKLNYLVTGYKQKNNNSEPCQVCIKGKQHRQPFVSSKSRTRKVLELVHSDLCGPMENTSIGGAKYLLTFIDDFSKKVFVYFLKTKAEVKDAFITFKNTVQNETGERIKILRTDNGTEYVNQQLKNILRQNGIKHQLTIPHTPQQNGVAERYNRTIIEKARSMIIDAKLPKKFWAEATATAAYLINRSPTNSREKTPEELWSKKVPNISHLRVFGCKAMAYIPKEKRQKLDPKSAECVFVGYLENSKGYRLINLKNNKLVKSRDVIFLENQRVQLPQEEANNIETLETVVTLQRPNEERHPQRVRDSNEESTIEEESFESIPSNDEETHTEITLNDSPETDHSLIETVTRRSTRTIKPKEYPDYITYLSTQNLSDPKSVREALSSPNKQEWKKAMEEEYQSLLENKTWELVEPPKNKKILKVKWVFKTKENGSGKIERYKARLVAKGCQQTAENYTEIFSPVIRYTTIRFLLALAVKNDFIIHHIDVVNAYLQGDLEEEVYLEQPEAFEVPGKRSQVCLLKKAIYGLKQSGRAWNKKLSNALQNMNFAQSQVDQCMYFKRYKDDFIIIAIYVDDLVVMAKREENMMEIKDQLMKMFKMKDLGEINNFLGMNIEVDKSKRKISICQSRYIDDILSKFKMSDCKPVKTPMTVGQDFNADPSDAASDFQQTSTPYMEAIGSLLYLSQISRPDISYAVTVLSQYCNNFNNSHWVAVKRILRYLNGTKNMKIEFTKANSSKLEGYCDADWGNTINNRHSISGYIFVFQNSPISWSAKKQRTVALSTTEAEYISLSSAVQEAIWLRALAAELDPEITKGPTAIYSDNRSAIDLAKTSNYKMRTKHIDVRHHFLRQRIEDKEIEILYMPTEDMPADMLTKILNKKKLLYCIEAVGLTDCNN